jgi:hypothetical protein
MLPKECYPTMAQGNLSGTANTWLKTTLDLQERVEGTNDSISNDSAPNHNPTTTLLTPHPVRTIITIENTSFSAAIRTI